MNKFFKSVWFPILLFIFIEIILLLIGYIMTINYCDKILLVSAIDNPDTCMTSGQQYKLAINGAILSCIISFITYIIIKKYSK